MNSTLVKFKPFVLALVSFGVIALFLSAKSNADNSDESYVVSFNTKHQNIVNKEKMKSFIEGRFRGDSDNFRIVSMSFDGEKY